MATSLDPVTPTQPLTRSEQKARRHNEIVAALVASSDRGEPMEWCQPREQFFAAFPDSSPEGPAVIIRRYAMAGRIVWEVLDPDENITLEPGEVERGIAVALASITPRVVYTEEIGLFLISQRHLEDARREWLRLQVGAGVRAAMDAEGGAQ